MELVHLTSVEITCLWQQVVKDGQVKVRTKQLCQKRVPIPNELIYTTLNHKDYLILVDMYKNMEHFKWQKNSSGVWERWSENSFWSTLGIAWMSKPLIPLS